jgi:acetyl esterase/lipase
MTRCWLGLLVVTFLVEGVSGQPAQPGPTKTLVLWENGAPGAVGKEASDIPTLRVFLPPADKATGAAIVICPGGGYGHLADKHEGVDVARWLNSIGVAGIVLNYRIAPRYRFPAPLQDAQRAMRLTRLHAKDWGIDPNRVGILGFSAGGHLASTASTHFDQPEKKRDDSIDDLSARPDFSILVYPVISFMGPHAHVGSRNNLLGKNPDPQLVESLCNEKQVTARTPPTFLVHTTEDTGVPPDNSIVYYQACRKAGVPVEMHIYDKGRHGLGLGARDLPFSSWPTLCEAWMRNLKLLEGKR